MIGTPTVLVLGAGASKPYGFPTGMELRARILELKGPLLPLTLAANLEDDSMLDALIRDFRDSDMASIDAFLGVNDRYVEIGKKAIAMVLMHFEEMSIVKQSLAGDWYAYLWNKVASGHAWDEVDFSNLSIVTFNYERSLEAYLVKVMRATFGRSEAEVFAKLAQLRITHVYGRLGSIEHGTDRYVWYGKHKHRLAVDLASSGINIMPEARDDSPDFDRAKDWLTSAGKVCFLGFGFDPLNVRRLGAGTTCGPLVRRPDGPNLFRYLCASAFELTDAEALANATAVNGTNSVGQFIDGDCLKTLRETLVLG